MLRSRFVDLSSFVDLAFFDFFFIGDLMFLWTCPPSNEVLLPAACCSASRPRWPVRSEVRLGAAGGETTEGRGFVSTISPRLPSLLDFDPSFLAPSISFRRVAMAIASSSWRRLAVLVTHACGTARHGLCRMLDCGGRRDADRDERGNNEDKNEAYYPRVG